MKSLLYLLLATTNPQAGYEIQLYERMRIVEAAVSIINPDIRYDPQYKVINYPGGDVPSNTGVCTDVVIRTYRKVGIDLQKEVHEDMKTHFNQYPKIWGRTSTDKNIDHRRVPNLMVFFSRKGRVLPITTDGKDYMPGDLVTWELSPGVTHIGLLTGNLSHDGKRPLVVHNIGHGQVQEDVLFDYKIIGHYYYFK